MKLITTIQGPRPNSTVKVYFDREWEEYAVAPSIHEDTWYYTPDKDDAIDTAKTMAHHG